MNEEKKTPEAPLSMQKRNALLRYMAILFAVAFALVLLSYLVQARNSRSTIDQLSTTSLSALRNAEALQATNRDLTEETRRLNDELDNAQAAILEYQESVAASRQATLAEGREAGKLEVQRAYDLLLAALNAADDAERVRALASLEASLPLLSEDAQKLAESLKITPVTE